MKASAPRPAPRPEYAGAGALEIRAAIQRCKEAARRRVSEPPPMVDPFGLIENGPNDTSEPKFMSG